jgi:pentatricopeptide repeat protein
MISGYAQHGYAVMSLELYNNLQGRGIQPDKYMYSGVLKACGSLQDIGKVRFIHGQLVNNGQKAEIVMSSALINVYIKCGSLQDAHKIFQELQEHDVILWGSLIGGYVEHGFFSDAINLFHQMQCEGTEPDGVIFMYIIKACSRMVSQKLSNVIYSRIVESGLETDKIIGGALVDMYCKSSNIKDAQKIFDHMNNQDVVSWVTMIIGCAEHGHGLSSLEMLDRMQQEGIQLCKVVLLCSLKACSKLKAMKEGQWLHDRIIRDRHESDVAVSCTLMDLYVKCEALKEAQKVLDASLAFCDRISWNVMIGAYVNNSHYMSALHLFSEMTEKSICPHEATILHVLKACGSLGSVELGNLVHDHILRSAGESYERVENKVLHMYAACGNFDDAHKMLSSMPNKDVASWGTMITAYSKHGKYSLAVKSFEEMQLQGVKPNHVIFTSLLAACSHSGLLEKAHEYFRYMTELHDVTPSTEQYNCMADLLVRIGHFDHAQDVALTLKAPPDVIMQTSLLASSKTYGKA